MEAIECYFCSLWRRCVFLLAKNRNRNRKTKKIGVYSSISSNQTIKRQRNLISRTQLNYTPAHTHFIARVFLFLFSRKLNWKIEILNYNLCNVIFRSVLFIIAIAIFNIYGSYAVYNAIFIFSKHLISVLLLFRDRNKASVCVCVSFFSHVVVKALEVVAVTYVNFIGQQQKLQTK